MSREQFLNEFFVACLKGNREKVRELISSNYDINERVVLANRAGRPSENLVSPCRGITNRKYMGFIGKFQVMTPLYLAVTEGHLEIVKDLLCAGAYPNTLVGN